MRPSDFFDKLKSKPAIAPVPENGTPDVKHPLACWLSAEGEPFISIIVPKPRRHIEHWPLSSARAKSLIRNQMSRQKNQRLSRMKLEQRLDELRADAECSGEVHEVYVRVAKLNSIVYIDLGDPSWRVIQITKNDWRILDRSPVQFRRSRTTRPFPEPVKGGSIELLKSFLNMASGDDFRLLCAWLAAVLAGVFPYPLLVLTGEAGSAKTTIAKIIVSLVDPRSPMTRALPGSIRDLMVAYDGAHLLAFDNVSKMPPWLSDALCRIATGAGFGTRTNYTDRDETVFEASRPVLLNGIPNVLWRPDLADRSIQLILPSIPEDRRRPVRELEAEFEAAEPQIFGALLDLIVAGLQRIDSVHPSGLPRMADFALWGIAIETRIGWPEDGFINAFEANHAAIIGDILEGNTLASAVIRFAEKQGSWEGTATELLEELRKLTPFYDRTRLPKSANWLSTHLRRLVGSLRTEGIEISVGENRIGTKRIIEIRAMDDANDARCRPAA